MESWSDIRSLEDNASKLRIKVEEPRSQFNHREINRAETELRATEERIKRDLKCRSLYNQIAMSTTTNLNKTPTIRRPPRPLKKYPRYETINIEKPLSPPPPPPPPSSLPVTENEVSRFLRDLTLPRPAAVDKRTLVYTDVCRCGAEMYRQPTMSFLICPVCSFRRIRVDMCPTDSNKTNFERAKGPSSGVVKVGGKGVHASISRHAPKTASHYGSFLNMNRRRKTCRVDPARLEELCKFAYVEGARSHNDITHQLLNLAQRHTAKGVEYQMTRIYVSLLRNDSIIIPDAVKKDLVKLYLYMHPVYSRYKHDEAKKSNMAKFSFVSRILCRLRGLDVLLPLFDNFTMAPIVIRRTSFMRRVFRRLGWKWCDAISDVKEKDLDKYDAENGITDIPDEFNDKEELVCENEEKVEEEEEEEEAEEEEEKVEEKEEKEEEEKEKVQNRRSTRQRKRPVTQVENTEEEKKPRKRQKKEVAIEIPDLPDDLFESQ